MKHVTEKKFYCKNSKFFNDICIDIFSIILIVATECSPDMWFCLSHMTIYLIVPRQNSLRYGLIRLTNKIYITIIMQ